MICSFGFWRNRRLSPKTQPPRALALKVTLDMNFNFQIIIQMENSILGFLQRFPVIKIRPSLELTLRRVSIFSSSPSPPVLKTRIIIVIYNLFTASKNNWRWWWGCTWICTRVEEKITNQPPRSFLNHHHRSSVASLHPSQNNGQQEPEELYKLVVVVVSI